MVTDTGKTIRADTFRPVNTQEPVRIKEDTFSLPIAVREKRRQTVIAINDRWRIDDEWWRNEPVSRLYYDVILTSGQRLVLYKDLTTGNWYRQSY